MHYIDFDRLTRMALASSRVTKPCGCAAVPLQAWSALPLTLERDCLEDTGALFEDPYDEPTFAEYHPAGTRYESADAPIAPRFYPYNRCTVARCTRCDRHYLRYNEAGGYFTELRIRALQAGLLVDAPA
jgi:hypothetical protein